LASCVREGDSTILLDCLKRAGFTVLTLDGKVVFDGPSFFAEAIRMLPLDPPLSGNVNWDVFSDSLWGGIDQLGLKQIAIVWRRAENMVQADLLEFLLAFDCLKNMASTIDHSREVKFTIKVLPFLTGEGTSFKPFWF